MSSTASNAGLKSILSVNLRREQDLVAARQRARQISALLGFNHLDQTRIATALSEIARNALEYAGGGLVEFSIDLLSHPQFFWIQVSDHGSGVRDLNAVISGNYQSESGMGIGVTGSRQLMDEFHIHSLREQGTVVRFGKALPGGVLSVDMAALGKLGATLAQLRTQPHDEVQEQSRALLEAFELLRQKELELRKRYDDLARLNVELEETNRGVLALYAELDEKAVALRRADEMKTRFLSHVSHEFRTPVNSVLALTRLLLERIDGDLTAEQAKQVSYIRDATQQLAEMVNDLLDLAKVESGKTELRLAPIDIAQLLGATRALMRPLASNDAVNLVFEEPEHPLLIEGDESKLGQILRNLISNSLKFTQTGEVCVSACLLASGQSIVFTVADTGIGIAPEDCERIFQEFTQIENPIQRSVKGTGLGLPLSRRLATLMGGTLTVESVPGEGSTFKLTLPYMPIEDQTAKPPSPQPLSTTILLVDDEEPARYLTRRLLTGTQREILDASAVDAAERARFERPALIFLDLSMPGKTGFEVLDELKANEETRDIPVVIQTSKQLSEAEMNRLSGQAVAILPKGENGRREALLTIRSILKEPTLFSREPEFS